MPDRAELIQACLRFLPEWWDDPSFDENAIRRRVDVLNDILDTLLGSSEESDEDVEAVLKVVDRIHDCDTAQEERQVIRDIFKTARARGWVPLGREP